MALSAESVKMKQALREITVPVLRNVGFKGSYPHFRRERYGKVELISFIGHNTWGGAFEVAVSIIFRDAADPKDSNLFYLDDATPNQKLTFGHGRIRHGLPGTFPDREGVFYYADVYKEIIRSNDGHFPFYMAVTSKIEKYTLDSLLANNAVLIKKADEHTYEEVALQVNEQLVDLFRWFDDMKTIEDLRKYDEQENARKQKRRIAETERQD